MSRVVLVTGVSRYLGGRAARVLAADPAIKRVIGVDVVPPPHDLGAATFVRADIRSPSIARVLSRNDVDTVVHLGVIATPQHAGGRAAMKEINVIGTMQLLAACQRLPAVGKLVVKSSTTVYGASAKDPTLFTEEAEPRELPRSGFAKDSFEVEGYVRGFARRRPDVEVTTLRFANAIGPAVRTSLTQYLGLSVVPTVLGFDPRLQLTHEDDLIEALRLATVDDVPGVVNVAGDGIMMLSQAIRRLGKPSVPMPGFAVGPLGQLFRTTKLADFTPEQVAFLTYGRGVDTSRMRNDLKLDPRYTTSQAFEAFAASVEHGPVTEQRVREAELALAAALGVRPRESTAEE